MTYRALVIAALLTGVLSEASAQVPVNTWSPIGPQFSTVLVLARDPATAGTMLAGTYFGGLYRSTDYGFNWQHVESPFSSRSIFSIAYAPAVPGRIFVSTFQGGVYRSDDNGGTWRPMNNGLTDLDVQVVVVDPLESHVVLATTSNAGVFRSADEGESWSRVDTEASPLRGKAIAFDPVEPGVVYLGSIGQGAFRSIDAGLTWARVDEGLTSANVLSLRFGAAPSADLYAAGDNGAYVLRRGAAAWTSITGDLPPFPVSDVMPHPTVEGVVFAGTYVGAFVVMNDRESTHWALWTPLPTRVMSSDPSGAVIHVASIHGGLEATIDVGANWYQANWGVQNLFVGALAVGRASDATPIVYAGSDYALHRGAMGGWGTFFDQKQGVFDIQIDPSTPTTLYLGSERGGVWKSTDAGTNWTASPSNVVPTQIYSLSQAADGQTLFAGTSSGLYMSPARGDVWIHGNAAQAGIVLTVAPDPVGRPFVFIGGSDGLVLRSEDGGWSFNDASNGLPHENITSLVTAAWEKTYAITGSGGLFATSDNGRNWFPAASGVDAPVLAIAADPARSWVLYAGTSGGGVYKSESGSLDWTPRNTGLTSPYVFSVVVNPTQPATILAGTIDGVFKSTDGAGTWTRSGAGLAAGAVTALVIDATQPLVAYASVLDAGLFRSADGGQTWTSIGGSLPGAGAMPVLVDRLDPSRLVAGTSLKGVFRSNDAGATWSSNNFGMTLFVRGLAIDPSKTTTVYAGSLGAGVFKSTDGGDSWTNSGLRDRNIFKLAVDPAHTNTVYAATSRGVSRSDDGATSWKGLGQKAAFTHTMVVDPRDRRRVFVGTTAGSVYRSTDAGNTWDLLAGGLPPYTIFALAIDASNGSLYASPERQGVWRSGDDGTTWVLLPGGALDDAFVASLAVGPNHEVYAGTVGVGVFVHSAGSWRMASSGLMSPLISDVDVTAGGTLVAATYDAGVFRSTDGGGLWTWASSGLSTSRVTSLTPVAALPSRMYAATPDGVFVTDDGAISWRAAHAGMRGVNTWAVAADPSQPDTLFASTNGLGVFRSTDGGMTWAGSIAGLTNLDVRSVAVGPTPGSLYAATLGGGVARSLDGGSTWAGGVTLELVDSFVLALAVNPENPSIIYAATAGRGVLKSINGGIDWQPATNGLGSLFLLSLAIDRQHPDTLYAGTADKGVFYTRDGGNSWHELTTGLFNHVVTSLAIDPGDSTRIYAGTEGGGVFANTVALPDKLCAFAVWPLSLRAGFAAASHQIAVNVPAGCSWRAESGSDWITVQGEPTRSGNDSLVISLAINIGQDARSGRLTVAGQSVVVVQEGLARLFRLSVTHTGTGAGRVGSDWLGIDCGPDCEQLFTDSLPVVLTPTAQSGSVFAGWEGDADCVDGAVTMVSHRACVARFELTDDFDSDGLPNLWETKFGLDAGLATGDHGPDGDPDGDGRTNAEELADGTHPRGFIKTYFARGAASSNDTTRLDLFNAQARDVRVLVHFVPDSATERISEYRFLPSLGRGVVDTASLATVIDGGFGVVIESDFAVVAERTVVQQSPHATDGESAVALSTTWFVASGTTRHGHRTYYHVFNPGEVAADLDVVYLISGGTPLFQTHTVPAGKRIVIDVGAAAGVADGDVAGAVVSSTPVVVEAVTLSANGDSSLAHVASPAPGFFHYVAAGETGPLVSTTLDVLNPTGSEAVVTLTYVLVGGGIAQHAHTIAPYTRQSINPAEDDALLASTTFGMVATTSTPIVVASRTWWPGATAGEWYEGAAAAALGTAGTRWAVAGGEFGGALNSQTEIAITNVVPRDGSVRITLAFDDGTAVTREFPIGAVSHQRIDIATGFPEAAWKTFSALVESLGVGNAAPPDIIVEHSTFTSPNGAARVGGTRVLATQVPE